MVSSVSIRPLLALLIMAALIGIAVMVFRTSHRTVVPGHRVGQQLPRNIDIALKNARFTEIQDGQIVWELVSERVAYDKNGDTAHLSGIRMEFQRNGAHGAVIVTADEGEYLSSEKNVRLAGNVVVTTTDGAQFKTNTIVYTGATTQFSTADPVFFRQQRLQLSAVGMELPVKDQQVRFRSSIVASVSMNGRHLTHTGSTASGLP